MTDDITIHEEQLRETNIDLVVGENYESISNGQKGVLVLADIEGDLYEIALANDTYLRKDLLARGIQTNYLWRGGFEELVNEWVYVGPSISGYNEGFSETCCNQGGCCKQHLDIPINASTFDNVVKMAKYGIDWLSDHPLEDPYRRASVETLAHVIACFVTQNFTNEPTPTEDMVGLIEDMPDEDIFRGRLTAYIL